LAIKYPEINPYIQALKTDPIVVWKGKKKALHYFKGISVDYPIHSPERSVF
jgi:hypothetical protein